MKNEAYLAKRETADTTDQTTREWLRVSEAQKYCGGVSKGTLYQWMNRGWIKSSCIKARGQIRGVRLISQKSLSEFLESHASGGEKK